MPTSKIAISLDAATLERLDTLVEKASFPSRNQVIQEEEKLARLDRGRLARGCVKLDLVFEKDACRRRPVRGCFEF
jgi:hypothetical protein